MGEDYRWSLQSLALFVVSSAVISSPQASHFLSNVLPIAQWQSGKREKLSNKGFPLPAFSALQKALILLSRRCLPSTGCFQATKLRTRLLRVNGKNDISLQGELQLLLSMWGIAGVNQSDTLRARPHFHSAAFSPEMKIIL